MHALAHTLAQGTECEYISDDQDDDGDGDEGEGDQLGDSLLDAAQDTVGSPSRLLPPFQVVSGVASRQDNQQGAWGQCEAALQGGNRGEGAGQLLTVVWVPGSVSVSVSADIASSASTASTIMSGRPVRAEKKAQTAADVTASIAKVQTSPKLKKNQPVTVLATVLTHCHWEGSSPRGQGDGCGNSTCHGAGAPLRSAIVSHSPASVQCKYFLTQKRVCIKPCL